jgi:hypothetical protein
MKVSRSHSIFVRLAAVVMLSLASISCTLGLLDPSQLFPSVPGSGGPNSLTATPAPLAETTFNLSLLTPLNSGETVAIGLLDEVTGLGLNPTLYGMNAQDTLHYTVTLPLPLNSTTKYRYYRQGKVSALEDTALDKPIRYRLHTASSPATLSDILASWSDRPFSGPVGRIAGTVTDAATGQPIANILVDAGGEATLTDSLGQYALESLPQGTQTVSAYALDGAYTPFQQGATIQADLTTTAPIKLNPAPTVQVTFNVHVPDTTITGAPLRLAGNLIQLGNTFSDLDGGMSEVATRMPTLTATADHQYSLTMSLPVGADIRYKYTLGDGFWNAEHSADGNFVLRQFIVPPANKVLNETVATWQAGTSAPILFDVTVPENTPPNETISIQFNPYGWTEPIPMWPLGEKEKNHWVYKLFGPFNMLGSFHYRYCRNNQCGTADDVATADSAGTGRSVNTTLTDQNLKDGVTAWSWWQDTEPPTIVAIPVNARPAGFWAGIEFQNNYQPDWQSLYPTAMQNIQGLGANTLVLAPTWTATSSDPLTFAPTPGSDPLMSDTIQTVQDGRARNMRVAIYATPRLLPSTPDFWLHASRTPDWWNRWFDRYRAFVIYHADLATRSGAQALIIGGDEVLPTLPGGTLVDGSSANVPDDAEARWRNLLNETRQHFAGQLFWAHPYGNALAPTPAFIDRFDAFYLLWSAPLATGAGSGGDALLAEAGRRLDEDIRPLLQTAQKPVVIAVDYPSAQGAAEGCVPSGGGCLDWSALSRPYPDIPSATINLKGQSDLYQALLQAINDRNWISGFVSRGYYPAASFMDKSSSVRSKMSAVLLWYWVPRFLGGAK